MNAYLVLVTWPDGTEGLLFPRPGNVSIANTVEKGMADFDTAKAHLIEYARDKEWKPGRNMIGTRIRLVPFIRMENPLAEFTMI